MNEPANEQTNEPTRPGEIILPDGSKSKEAPEKQRQEERKSEDQEYVPVIIKRTDETRRHPDDALHHAIDEGLEQLDRPMISLLISVDCGRADRWLFGDGSRGRTNRRRRIECTTNRPSIWPLRWCIRWDLFSAFLAVPNYLQSTRRLPCIRFWIVRLNFATLIRLWSVVIVGNLIGAIASASLHYSAVEVTHARPGYIEIGHHLTKFSVTGLFVSAVLAGWLMALGAWLVGSSPRTIAQIALIYVVTFLIGVGGLHHSIAGSVEMFAAMFLDSQFTPTMAGRFISIALLGNLGRW